MPHFSFAEEGVSNEDLFIPIDSTWYLSADKTEYNNKSGIVKAKGNVRLESESSRDILECEEGSFNRKDQTGELINGVLFLSENNFHIRGAFIEKAGKDTYNIKDFSLTTCDNSPPSWSITGSEINVVKEGYGKVKHAAFRIRDFPVFYLPYLIFPAKTTRQTGLLLPQFDYSDMNGAGIEIPFFWAISNHSDATLYGRYLTRRGIMQGLEFRFITGNGSKGEFLMDVLRDKIKEKDLTDHDQAEITPFERNNQYRYWLRGRLDQALSHDLTARLDLDLVSDQDYLREFVGEFIGFEGRPDLAEDFGRPVEERLSSFRRSALRISRDGEEYSLQGSGYYYQIPQNQGDDTTAQPLAGMFYSLLPEKLPKLPLFFTMDADYNYIWRVKGITGHSMSISPVLSYPKQLGDYLKLDSSIGYTGHLESHDSSYNNKENIMKDAYQAKAEIYTVVERIFGPDLHTLTRLKHKVTPSIAYEYRTHSEDQDISPWFDPIDSESNRNRISLSIENLLDAALRDENGAVYYRQWMRFDITQGYSLKELKRDDIGDEDKEVWEPLVATLILNPFKSINIRAVTKWDHYKDKFLTTVLSGNLSIPRSGEAIDRYYIDYIQVDNNSDSLNLRTDVNIINGFLAGVYLNRDLDLKYNIHSSFWLGYQAQCWSIKFGMEKEDENRSINLKFQLAGF